MPWVAPTWEGYKDEGIWAVDSLYLGSDCPSHALREAEVDVKYNNNNNNNNKAFTRDGFPGVSAMS